ncbi:Alpha/Beta hydrolase fold [Naviculisporaceae sp. PSN 640]
MRFLRFIALTVQMLGASATPGHQHVTTGTVKTSDGINLLYNQTGPRNGQDILFITGWRQAQVEWRKQTEYFASAGFRVTTYDMRGHGDSEEPEFGYRMSRFAADLNDVLTKLNLRKVTIVGHSMGCSVTWAWWDQYPESRNRASHFVFVDQSAVIVADPTWPAGQAEQLSAIFSPTAAYELAADMANQLAPLVKSMFTAAVSEADYDWVLAQNRKMTDAHSAALFLDHSSRDWRDVFPRITVPTLVIGGEVSVFPPAGIEWIAGQIPGAEKYIFSAAEKGSHFMFWENPTKFNSLVKDFVTKKK